MNLLFSLCHLKVTQSHGGMARCLPRGFIFVFTQVFCIDAFVRLSVFFLVPLRTFIDAGRMTLYHVRCSY